MLLKFVDEKDPSPEIKGRLEELLFVATKTVTTRALARGLDLPEPQAEELLRELAGACACGISPDAGGQKPSLSTRQRSPLVIFTWSGGH